MDRLPLATKDSRGNLIRAFKASGCVECKRRYPELDWSELHVDHIDPRNKPRGGTVVGGGGGGAMPLTRRHGSGGVAAMISELLGCQVLCRDCHVAKHRNGNGAVSFEQLALFSGTGQAWR